MQPFLEIKKHKNKPDQQFTCELRGRGPGWVVLHYHARASGQIADIRIPAGSTTIAFYREHCHHVLWRMYDARRHLLGSLFHICQRVEITPHSVTYEDLLLDVWLTPTGRLRVLDRDEFDDCWRCGRLSAAERGHALRALQQVTTCAAQLIERAETTCPAAANPAP